MRKLAIFIVLLIGIMSLIGHLPEHKVATVKKSETLVQTKPEPKIEAATYAAPAEPVAPPVPVYTVAGGCEQYRTLISQYDWDVSLMMAIMQAESSCVSDRVGDDYPIAGVHAVSCGLFQVRTISPARGTCEQLKDPAFNIDKAYGIYKGQGLTAWSVYTNGKYLQYRR